MNGKKHILIVDDTLLILRLAEDLLKDTYRVSTAKDGIKALSLMESDTPDLVLLDILMPGMDGYAVCKKMKETPSLKDIPVIFLTTDTHTEAQVTGFALGAMDFIGKPIIPEIMLKRIERVLELEDLRHNLEAQVEKKSEQLQSLSLQSITAIAQTIDAKDRYTKGHSVRVARYSVEIAKQLHWSKSALENLYTVALLHDIGKIGIPESILNKPFPVTPEEFDAIKTHTTIGADILKEINRLPNLGEGALYHHERYDGKGYRSGLEGEEIPLVARIISIADAYDAMTSNRAYRKRLEDAQVIKELKNGRGTQFDPDLTDIMLRLIEEGRLTRCEDEYQLETSNDSFAAQTNNLLQQIYQAHLESIQSESERDSLTGFLLRTHFEEYINRYLQEPDHACALFMLDIDFFKQVNDSHGHITGDKTILALADSIKEALRPGDSACRIGGDEFAVFLEGHNTNEELNSIAEKIIDGIRLRGRQMTPSMDISISVGIAKAPENGTSFLELYQNADKALYHVKQNGKGHYWHYDTQPLKAATLFAASEADMLHLMTRIREMAENNTGAFQVGYEYFEQIYEFILRNISRNGNRAQLVLFTLTEPYGGAHSIEELEEGMAALERIASSSLRKGDVMTRYGASQLLVILMNADQNGGNLVAARILSGYQKGADSSFELHYDLQEVTLPVSKAP